MPSPRAREDEPSGKRRASDAGDNVDNEQADVVDRARDAHALAVTYVETGPVLKARLGRVGFRYGAQRSKRSEVLHVSGLAIYCAVGLDVDDPIDAVEDCGLRHWEFG